MIEVKSVSKSFGRDPNKVDVLKEISFSVKDGAFVIIKGTSGSGKTTLLNLSAFYGHWKRTRMQLHSMKHMALKELDKDSWKSEQRNTL